MDTPTVWWELYPEAFHHNYHTKAGIQKLNEIEFFFSDGSRISNYNERHYDSLEESKAVSRRVQFYSFLLFVVVVRGTGLFLCDELIHRNKRIRSQINHLLHLFIMKKIILQMLAFTAFTVPRVTTICAGWLCYNTVNVGCDACLTPPGCNYLILCGGAFPGGVNYQ